MVLALPTDPRLAARAPFPIKPPTALAGSSFEHFPARPYLEKYYSGMGPENAALLEALTFFCRDLEPDLARVVEVGGGPIVLPLLALTAARGRGPGRVLFGDIAPANLAEVERWLVDHPEQFDWSATLEWLERHMGAQPHELVRSLRASSWELREIDMREPLPADLLSSFDTVSSHFFADSATADEREFVEFLAKVRLLGAPGATFFLSFMCRSSGYAIGAERFPAIALDPETLLPFLARAGFALSRFKLHAVPTEGHAEETGYEGLMFVAGTLDDGQVPRAPRGTDWRAEHLRAVSEEMRRASDADRRR